MHNSRLRLNFPKANLNIPQKVEILNNPSRTQEQAPNYTERKDLVTSIKVAPNDSCPHNPPTQLGIGKFMGGSNSKI